MCAEKTGGFLIPSLLLTWLISRAERKAKLMT